MHPKEICSPSRGFHFFKRSPPNFMAMKCPPGASPLSSRRIGSYACYHSTPLAPPASISPITIKSVTPDKEIDQAERNSLKGKKTDKPATV
jgi:hypothetical protein